MSKEPRPRSFLARFFPSSATSTSSSQQQASGDSSKSKNKLRRDFCFNTHNGPVFFSTRDEFCTRFGGFRHGDVVVYGPEHPLTGCRAVIVGERGGQLWAVDDGSSIAHQLQAMPGDSDIVAKYGFKKVGTQQLTPAAPQAGLTPKQQELLCTLPDLMVRINEGREMQHLVPCISGEPARIGWTGVGYVHDGSEASVASKVYLAATAVL